MFIIKLSPPDTEDLTKRAIQDISAGGTSIPGSEAGYIALWAVNFAGKVRAVHLEGLFQVSDLIQILRIRNLGRLYIG